ncbi:heterocyst formation ABC transporter subunit HepA [Rhodothermus profundi]|uniref:ATP-binding cassette, subfamily B, MsbA n=1 Tax=Rhodothermus profundi TaxID=633813 RepID=A0A1M6XI91_9BACT|nr:heterocyst formation ABC transporter subunit HepA [Rhodothermus profundi]SHL05569.1 ATP-binding cassette, subfamily B, MsbA [Rhodothermus profundi]
MIKQVTNGLRRHLWRQEEGMRLILQQLWAHRRLFVLTVVLTGLGAAFEGVGLGLLVPFLDSLMNPEAKGFATGWAWIDQHLLRVDAPVMTRLYWFSGLILLAILLRGGLGYAAQQFSIRLQEAILHRLRCQIVDQLQAVSLKFYAHRRAGDLLNVLTAEIQRLRFLFGTSSAILINGFLLVVYGTAIFALSWSLALVAIGMTAGLFVVVRALVERLKREGNAITRTNSWIASRAQELIAGIRTVLTHGAQAFESARFRRVSQEAADVVVQISRKQALIGPLSQAVASIALIGLIIVAVQYFVLPGRISMAVLITFLFAFFRMLPLVQNINNLRAMWAKQRGAVQAVADILRRDDKPYLPDGTIPFEGLREAIELRHVSFGYEPGQRVLHDINLTIRRGQTVAFVGASGAGKSTLADLIVRLYDPDEGQILYDGVDLRQYRIDTIRRRVAVVSQDTFLFHDTIRANIAYGLEDVSEERIRWAAAQANALEFIEQLPEGFDTVVGDRGTRLSGGQRQRIAIARALLRDPDILVLDEATSALDSVSERLVQEALERLMAGRTVIVIAHRLSTIENVDLVVVLEAGRIVEQGTYDELIERKGYLWTYYRLQHQLV